MDDLEEHLLIGDGVHQSVGTQQQVLPGVHRAYVPVTVGGDVRSQGPGDEIAAGVAAGLLSGDISPVYHALHQGVVLGDAGDAVLRDVISPAVPHVGDHHAAVIGDGGHDLVVVVGVVRPVIAVLAQEPASAQVLCIAGRRIGNLVHVLQDDVDAPLVLAEPQADFSIDGIVRRRDVVPVAVRAVRGSCRTGVQPFLPGDVIRPVDAVITDVEQVLAGCHRVVEVQGLEL